MPDLKLSQAPSLPLLRQHHPDVVDPADVAACANTKLAIDPTGPIKVQVLVKMGCCMITSQSSSASQEPCMR